MSVDSRTERYEASRILTAGLLDSTRRGRRIGMSEMGPVWQPLLPLACCYEWARMVVSGATGGYWGFGFRIEMQWVREHD